MSFGVTFKSTPNMVTDWKPFITSVIKNKLTCTIPGKAATLPICFMAGRNPPRPVNTKVMSTYNFIVLHPMRNHYSFPPARAFLKPMLQPLNMPRKSCKPHLIHYKLGFTNITQLPSTFCLWIFKHLCRITSSTTCIPQLLKHELFQCIIYIENTLHLKLHINIIENHGSWIL